MIRLKVKALAKEQKISQSQLSRMANVDPGTMRRIYSGSANITLETLNRLAKALKCQPSELLDYQEDESIF